MKKLLYLLFILGSLNQSNAQTINGMLVEDIPAKYVEIVVTTKPFKRFKVTVYLDYGQIKGKKEIEKGYIIGDDGKVMGFNGPMGVLNALDKKGFNYISQYRTTHANIDVHLLLFENTNYKE